MPFIKSDGCNKMTCSCRTLLCYICRKEITKSEGYKHFCQTPHCKHKEGCNKCQLYSNADEDDERAMREAGISAAQRYQEKVQSETNANVQIDVETILANPGARAKAKAK
jgi:hypothetical protein